MNTKDFVSYQSDLEYINASQVMFVGLSYKLDKEGKVLKAFCDSTNS
jgi:hypothetical protein